MSKYVVADIHGDYKAFKNLLDIIKFKDTDLMYIVGDVIDRGPEPLALLDFIRSKDNIILIKGNHEELMEEYLTDGSNSFWFGVGGDITYSQLIERGEEYAESLVEYLANLPLYCIVDDFLLVHSGINLDLLDVRNYSSLEAYMNDYCLDYPHVLLYRRDNIGRRFKFKKYKLIVGHTTVQVITKGKTNKILNIGSTFYIDCACGFKHGHLGCLRLDDLKQFYA